MVKSGVVGSGAGRPFLTARWESLILLNYSCPIALLEPLVPRGVELDLWDGTAYVSLVGFLFADTRVKGIPIPFHRTFEEVNLRFYVQRTVPGEPPRRGVVFIKELVPRWAISTVARVVYNEPYQTVPMESSIALDQQAGGQVAFRWMDSGRRFSMEAKVTGPAEDLVLGSEAEFITEHYWGYTRQRDGGTLEYRVDHSPWQVWTVGEPRFSGPAGVLYGEQFGAVLDEPPVSAFLAVGSGVEVHSGVRIG